MIPTTQIRIHRLATGWWTATQKQGSAQLPVTVASMSKTSEGVLASVNARQSAGMIASDAKIVIEEVAS